MLEKELQDIGLNEKEARVYLAAMELGQSVVQDIAKKADVNRATTYFIIEELMKKGLMSSFYQGKKQHFMAEDPEKLKLFLKQQENTLKERQVLLEKALPQLKSVNIKGKDVPVVRYYEGVKGLRIMMDDLMTGGDDTFDVIYSHDLLGKILSSEENSEATDKRVHRGIKSRAIYTYSKGRIETANSERIKLPTDKFPITCDIAIFDNKVRIASLNKKISGIMIEDEDIYKTMKTIFELAWEAAKNHQENN